MSESAFFATVGPADEKAADRVRKDTGRTLYTMKRANSIRLSKNSDSDPEKANAGRTFQKNHLAK